MNPKKNKNFTDSGIDKKNQETEEFTLDLPDATEIPGQEKIKPRPLGELEDTAISSDDEEGAGILDNPDEQDENSDQTDTNVTRDERKVLNDAANKIITKDEMALEQAKPDQRDEEGDLLNEKAGNSGNDLDVPGSELDDENEEIGEEDEENNLFSLDDQEDDNNTAQ